MDCKAWELWYAKVKFEDNPDEVKERPVLIIDNSEAYILAFKVTSHEPRADSLEYEIIKWVSAGLSKESTIRLSKKLELLPQDIIRKIGKLHPFDIAAIQNRIE